MRKIQAPLADKPWKQLDITGAQEHRTDMKWYCRWIQFVSSLRKRLAWHPPKPKLSMLNNMSRDQCHLREFDVFLSTRLNRSNKVKITLEKVDGDGKVLYLFQRLQRLLPLFFFVFVVQEDVESYLVAPYFNSVASTTQSAMENITSQESETRSFS